MKNNLFTLILFLLFIGGFSQNNQLYYFGRTTPIVKKEKLNSAKIITDVCPNFWNQIWVPKNEMNELKYRKSIDYPDNYIYPKENYNNIIDCVSFEIIATCSGKTYTCASNFETLSSEQKNILNSSDLGSEIHINVTFKFKKQSHTKSENFDKIINGGLTVTVVPEKEAEFPGGSNKLTDYLMKNVITKIPEIVNPNKIIPAVAKFTVNEMGKIIDVKIEQTSKNLKVDHLLWDAIYKMPKWKPAENSKGEKVKEEFIIPLGGGC
ncbi:MAG: hypothetical protein SFY56_13910 [Bacteroidota bacterium]|nr:hypothetical protein [Bacteroidota bacterium]